MNIAAIIVGIDGLGDVSPSSTHEQSVYRLWVNIVLGCKFSVSHFAGRMTPANLGHLLGGQLCMTSFFANCFSLTPFGDHVLRIIKICSKKQMTRIDTGRIIAFMANQHAFGDWSIGQFVRESMRRNVSRVVFELAIAAAAFVAFATKPEPTVIQSASIHHCPKSIFRLGHASAMAAKKLTGLALDPFVAFIVAWRNSCLLSTTAMAKAVGNIKRGIMGLHKKFTFLVSRPWTVPAVAGLLLLVRTPVIIPQLGGVTI